MESEKVQSLEAGKLDKVSGEGFGFEKLKVYQKALDYIDYIYELTAQFPKEEVYALASQFKRASYSIALNIGEGSGGTTAEFKNFIRISYRSASECVVCSTIAQRRNISARTRKQRAGNMLPRSRRC